MVWGDKKCFDFFIGKQLRHYLEDKEKMAVTRRMGIAPLTRQEYEARPPGNVNWGPSRGQVAIRSPPRALVMSHPQIASLMCPACGSDGPPDPEQPGIPYRHRAGCPYLHPPRRGPRRGVRYPTGRGPRGGRRGPGDYDDDSEYEEDWFRGEEEEGDPDFEDLEDFEPSEEDDFAVDDGYTERSRRSYTRRRPNNQYSDRRRHHRGGYPDPRDYPRGGHHDRRRMGNMYPPNPYRSYGHQGPVMMGGGHRGLDWYGPEDDSTTITY